MGYLLFLLLLPFFTQAQHPTTDDVSYKLGEEFDGKGGDASYYFHKDNETIHLIANIFLYKYTYTIQKIDVKTATILSEEVYKTSLDHVFEGAEMIDGKIFIFYSKFNLKAKEELLADEIDWETGKLKKLEKSILKIDYSSFSIENKYSYRIEDELTIKMSFDIKQSADSSKLLIKYWIPETEQPRLNDIYKGNKYQVRMGFHVLDTEFNPVWNTIVEMPYPARKMEYLEFTLDAFGNVYFLASVFNKYARKPYTKDGQLNRHFELLKVDAKTQKLSNSKIQLDGYHIQDLALGETAKKKMICVGYYTEDREIETNLGAFLGEINPTDNSVAIKTYSFEENLRFDEGTVSNLKVEKIVALDDGSIVLFGEEQSVLKIPERADFHYFDDVIITRFTPNYTVAWMKGLQKKQGGESKYRDLGMLYLSYHNNHHYLLYLTHRKNIQRTDIKKYVRHEAWYGGYVIAAKISDSNGLISKQTLFDVDQILPDTRKGLLINMSKDVRRTNSSLVLRCFKKGGDTRFLKFNVK